MSKHTEGPWAWGSFGAGVLVVQCNPDGSPNKHRPICNLNSQYTFPLDVETVANANLISAAPALLEALQAVMQGSRYCEIQGYADWHEIAMPTRAALDKARAAIATATQEASHE